MNDERPSYSFGTQLERGLKLNGTGSQQGKVQPVVASALLVVVAKTLVDGEYPVASKSPKDRFDGVIPYVLDVETGLNLRQLSDGQRRAGKQSVRGHKGLRNKRNRDYPDGIQLNGNEGVGRKRLGRSGSRSMPKSTRSRQNDSEKEIFHKRRIT